MFAVWVVVWVVSSGDAAFIAWTKHRDVGRFALLGFFLGPVGLLITALASDGESIEQRPRLSRHL